jgi:ubiquinone/menaquinone biosynthesis C-methylase UbiE
MSVYRDHVLPRIINRVCASKQSAELRERACADLSGHIMEVGFGSGLNVPFYPADVTRVDAVEPSDVAWRLASERIRRCPVPVARTGRDGAALPYRDDTFDAALSTWTLCTIPDVEAALSELRRALKPGGVFSFVEHGLAPDPRVRTWQHRLEPVQTRMAGGCHLTRSIHHLLESAGFDVHTVEEFYEPGAPRVLGAITLGAATSS